MDAAIAAAVQVNALLSKYVGIEDSIFQFSLRKLLPIPVIFKPIKYGVYHEQLVQIEQELKQIMVGFQEWRATRAEQHPFFDVFSEYVDELNNAVYHLRGVCYQLSLKAEGNQGYDYSHYQGDLAAYRESVSGYVRKGETLNSRFDEYKKSRAV